MCILPGAIHLGARKFLPPSPARCSPPRRYQEAKALKKSGDVAGATALLDAMCNDYPEAGKVWMARFKIARQVPPPPYA